MIEDFKIHLFTCPHVTTRTEFYISAVRILDDYKKRQLNLRVIFEILWGILDTKSAQLL